MKNIKLKINGSLFVVYDPDQNFWDQLQYVSIFTKGMNKVDDNTDIGELYIDKDTELNGNIYTNEIIVPDGISLKIECAGLCEFAILDKSKTDMKKRAVL